jgi:PAS domain-containing protein
LPGDLSETVQAVAIARASDAVMVEVSDGFCALVGRRREEILGRTADQLGISDRARLDWLIDRFPSAAAATASGGCSRRPTGRAWPSSTSTGSSWAASG